MLYLRAWQINTNFSEKLGTSITSSFYLHLCLREQVQLKRRYQRTRLQYITYHKTFIFEVTAVWNLNLTILQAICQFFLLNFFSKRRLGASQLYSDIHRELVEERKQTPSPYPLTYRIGPSASSSRFFNGQKNNME